jgi:hypothetical protein
MTLSARSWRSLDGLLLSDCSQPDLIECTYYQNSEHHWANLNSLSFRCAKQIGELSVTLSLHIPSETNSDEPAITMTVEGEVIFEGIIVVPGNLSPSPVTPQEAAKTAAAFADLERFREPIWDRFRYVFGPIS